MNTRRFHSGTVIFFKEYANVVPFAIVTRFRRRRILNRGSYRYKRERYWYRRGH
jgi:hypothetical protein